MRAQAWVMMGLAWLALPAMLDRPGLRWLPPAYAQPKGPDKPSDRPSDKPGDKPSDKPGAKSSDHPSPPAGDPSVVAPPGRERPPQVRTYSSVTVVDDPRQAPPLPTGRKELSAPAAPRPPTEPRRDDSPASSPKDDRPSPGARRAEELKELRRDLRELRQDLREHRGARGDEPPERLRGPVDPEGKKRPERAPLRERLRNGRD